MNYENLTKQFNDFSSADEENHTVLAVISDGKGQYVHFVGTGINLAASLAIAMREDSDLTKVITLAVDAAENAPR